VTEEGDGERQAHERWGWGEIAPVGALVGQQQREEREKKLKRGRNRKNVNN
jgi:hypothetical protein